MAYWRAWWTILVITVSLEQMACTKGQHSYRIDRSEGPAQPAGLWPLPQHVQLGNSTVGINVKNFQITCEVDNPCPHAFVKRLVELTNFVKDSCANQIYPREESRAHVESELLVSTCAVKMNTGEDTMNLSTNHTFKITVSSHPVPYCNIEAENMYGAYYAIQSVAQLCDTSGTQNRMREAQIIDYPRFPFRGLLVDTARHFLPISYLKSIVDTMALHRYNVLHWHIVDSESFPCESKTFPNLSYYGAWDPAAVYSTEDMRSLVAYAKSRGVIVMPEFDIPGHGSWGMGYPDLMGCSDVLDPTKPEVYEFLSSFLEEMLDVFPSEYFFLGGDEVDSSCWLENSNIAQWLKQHNMSDTELFDYFWKNVTSSVLPKLQRKVGVWESNKLDINPALLPAGSFGNVWQSPSNMGVIIDQGMPVVLSGTYYLDQENPQTDFSKCKKYAWQQTWKCMYEDEPFVHLQQKQQSMFMGGEAAMWGEGVNRHDFETRVWSRAAAVAERLWSSQMTNDSDLASPRLVAHICRLNMMGIRAGPILPSFCRSDIN